MVVVVLVRCCVQGLRSERKAQSVRELLCDSCLLVVVLYRWKGLMACLWTDGPHKGGGFWPLASLMLNGSPKSVRRESVIRVSKPMQSSPLHLSNNLAMSFIMPSALACFLTRSQERTLVDNGHFVRRPAAHALSHA